jgi:anti-sigma regulatory factor (Ser/Thr protein kinase)
VERSGVDAARRVQLNFPATMAGFEQAFGALQSELDRDDLNPGTRYSVELVFEEIVANIVRHGSGDGGISGVDVDVAVDVHVGGDAIVMTFDDGGVPFNPVGRPDPKRATSIEETPIGGLGLMMVRKAATEMRYERTPEQRNRLVVTLPATPTKAG